MYNKFKIILKNIFSVFVNIEKRTGQTVIYRVIVGSFLLVC